jgi:hypothetical protein
MEIEILNLFNRALLYSKLVTEANQRILTKVETHLQYKSKSNMVI